MILIQESISITRPWIILKKRILHFLSNFKIKLNQSSKDKSQRDKRNKKAGRNQRKFLMCNYLLNLNWLIIK